MSLLTFCIELTEMGVSCRAHLALALVLRLSAWPLAHFVSLNNFCDTIVGIEEWVFPVGLVVPNIRCSRRRLPRMSRFHREDRGFNPRTISLTVPARLMMEC